MSEDAAKALGEGEVVAMLGCSEVTPWGVVKATTYVPGYPPLFCFEAGLGFAVDDLLESLIHMPSII